MVLGRIASNFVSVERERRQTMKNENTPPSKANRGIRSAFSQKIVSSLSSISAASRRRRARLHGGLEKDRHRVADSARRRERTQSRSRTHTPPVTVASRSPPAMVDEEDRMETEDCEMSEVVPSVEPSAPAFRGVTLPRRLARPAYRPANTAALAAIEPGLAETNIEYVRDCLEATGASMLNVLARTSVLSTSTKPISVPSSPNGGLGQRRQDAASLPSEATVRVADTRADLPTHMLAVYSSLPAANHLIAANGQTQVRTRVSLLPIHAVMLAAHCAAVPPLPSSDPSRQTQMKTNRKENGEVVLTLPVVPLSIPSPTAFPLLSAYLYTQDSDNLLRALLGVPLSPTSSPTHSSVPTILLSPADSLPTPAPSPQLLPRSDLAPVPPSDSPVGLAAEFSARVSQTSRALAAVHIGDGDALLKKVGFVMGLWRNAYALGVYDSGLWSTLDAAWAVLLGAMAICERTGHTQAVRKEFEASN